ncbi:MAG: hypothetical protein QOK36_1622 [Gaiellales bacterium]|nr:hypothetical protein [Gaiellales bacterium]
MIPRACFGSSQSGKSDHADGKFDQALTVIRALTTLIGLVCAAALLLLVNDAGAAEGGALWKRAALLVGAGLVAGAFYQLGGIRRPGVRLNLPLFVWAFLPWTLLTLAICSNRSGTPVWLSDIAHDLLPESALTRWSPSFPILAFTDGLLFAFALVEPLVERVHHVAAIPTAQTDEPASDATLVRPARTTTPAGQPGAE